MRFLAVFDGSSRGFGSPEGAKSRKPRATPWVIHWVRFEALKGRNFPGGCRPFRAREFVGLFPRAMPWAFNFRPFGALHSAAHNSLETAVILS
ncbi:MAG: hypothetical protein RLZZ15_1080 [Verrucomicrobiota bacterium]|jgi:hypothetical protein